MKHHEFTRDAPTGSQHWRKALLEYLATDDRAGVDEAMEIWIEMNVSMLQR